MSLNLEVFIELADYGFSSSSAGGSAMDAIFDAMAIFSPREQAGLRSSLIKAGFQESSLPLHAGRSERAEGEVVEGQLM